MGTALAADRISIKINDPWRRRRDSNPRYGLTPYGGLANRWFQPLTHVSSGSRAAGYIIGAGKLQPEPAGYLATTSNRMMRLISSPGSSTRIPSSAHCSSGAFSAALAWVTGSATKMPPDDGE